MLKVVSNKKEVSKEIESNLDLLVRDGAKKMLMMALEMEVEEYVSRHIEIVDARGHRLVVKNGVGQTRTITVGSGSIDVRAPRVDDRRDGKKFLSSILPPYLRKSPKVESLLPLLYLKGLSTNDFKSALSEFLGDGTLGLSPASIVKLKKQWDDEYESWSRRRITKRYVYIWADGVYVSIRLGEDKRICLLVILGATEDGDKEVLAVHPGYRESAESWSVVLRSLIDRGMTAPLLAIGDGALGFWKALRSCEGFEKTEEQRCWVHKIANVLDKLPKRIQGDAKKLLHEMMKANTENDAISVRQSFEKFYNDKYPKAAECSLKTGVN
jgi:putative transposase